MTSKITIWGFFIPLLAIAVFAGMRWMRNAALPKPSLPHAVHAPALQSAKGEPAMPPEGPVKETSAPSSPPMAASPLDALTSENRIPAAEHSDVAKELAEAKAQLSDLRQKNLAQEEKDAKEITALQSEIARKDAEIDDRKNDLREAKKEWENIQAKAEANKTEYETNLEGARRRTFTLRP